MVKDFYDNYPLKDCLEVCDGFRSLTPRQYELVQALADGLNTEEIAARLYITAGTVKSHMGTILEKTGCRDRVQLLSKAFREGIVQ